MKRERTSQRNMVTGIILAGGKNQRMGGKQKALLSFAGERFIVRAVRTLRAVCTEVLIVANAPSVYLDLGCPLVGDIHLNKGPLGGIHSGLFYASHSQAFVVASDMPFLNEKLINQLIALAKGYDIVVPVLDGQYQPLHALYGKACLPRLTSLLAADKLKITGFYHGHKLRAVAEQELAPYGEVRRAFTNINAPADVIRLSEREGQ